MKLKRSNKSLVVLAFIGLTVASQRPALAASSSNWLASLFGSSDPGNNQNPPDQKQIQADQTLASQYEQAYQSDRQALSQAYSSGDRQNIQTLQKALNTDIGHLQANAQDLSKDGVANPNAVPSYWDNTRSGGRKWDREPRGQDNNNGRWQQNSEYAHQGDWNGRHHRYEQSYAR